METRDTLLAELPVNLSDPLGEAIADFNDIYSKDPNDPDLRYHLRKVLKILPPNVNSILFNENLSVQRDTDFPEPEVWSSEDVLNYMDFLFNKQLGIHDNCITDYQIQLHSIEIYSDQIDNLLKVLYSPHKQFDKDSERVIWKREMWDSIFETVFKLLEVTPGNYNGLDLGGDIGVIIRYSNEHEEENILTPEQLYKIQNILECAWSKNDCTNNV